MTLLDSTQTDELTRLTLVVLFYNQEAFAEQAVRGALAQTYSPLEIVLSDDASSDETFAVVQRTVDGYDGPHQVILNRNTINLGLTGNLNRAMELASGEIIVFTGGDDISL
ncbi:MAG: glycosyltransferase family A protein, partial [Acidimicrobiales bacterium]